MNKTSIEWCDFTWNPIRARNTRHNERFPNNPRTGTFCTKISPGCKNCYASVINRRFGTGDEYEVPNLAHHEFYLDEKILAEPLKRKKPATIFVGDMFDLFHEAIPRDMIVKVLEICSKRHGHTMQILTKRTARMRAIVTDISAIAGCDPPEWMWFGASVEDQPRADQRIPDLLQTPAAVRFLSVEPMLEAVDLRKVQHPSVTYKADVLDGIYKAEGFNWPAGRCVDWVICGGESGHGARPMHPNWPRSLRDQCQAASVPFFFKQWGEWQPHVESPDRNGSYHGGVFLLPNGQLGNQGDWWEGRAWAMDRMGKKKSGALLDGREWHQFPSQKVESVSA